MNLKALLAILVLASASAVAQPVLQISGGTINNNPTGSFTYGWDFHVNSAITLTQLGLFDENGDGFAESHDVGIWDSSGTLLRSTVFAAGSGALLDSGFRMQAVTSLNLTVGSTYTLGSNNMDVDRFIRDGGVTLTVDPAITYLSSRYVDSGGVLTQPTNTVGVVAYFGPNFSATPTTRSVPDSASTVGLLVLSFAALAAVRRRCR